MSRNRHSSRSIRRALSRRGQPPIETIDRRRFVKTAGGILVAGALGCAETTGDGPMGTLEVHISGLASGAASAGTATATPAGGGTAVTVNIPGSGSGSAQVPVGTYNVSYTPPTGYQVAQGSTVPSSITIVATQTTTVSLTLSAITTPVGTLHVSVTGLAGGAPSGGTAVATPTGGGAATNINIPGSGTASTSLPPGSYSVAYTAPANYTVSGGTTNPQTVSVTASQTTNVSFGVTASNGTFPTPNILNNASFETNFNGMVDGGFNAPATCVRDTARAFDGTYSVKRVLAANSANSGDIGGALALPFYVTSNLKEYIVQGDTGTFDRLWTRWYFYLDGNWDGTFKFAELVGAGFSAPLRNTIYFFGGNTGAGDDSRLGLFLDPEITSSSVSSHVKLSSLVGAWHWIEVDYWINGDTSNGGNDYPSMAIWLDGVQWNGNFGLPSPASWVGGRINFGKRTDSGKIGAAKWLGTLNHLTGTVQANVWVDRIAVSSVGRIGP